MKIIKHLRYIIEFLIIVPVMFFLYLMPMHIASNLMGWLLQLIGPTTEAHKIATSNIMKALPQLNKRQRKKIITSMWNNIGRIVGEFCHWYTASDNKFLQLVTIKDYTKGKFQQKKPYVFMSAHYGNWELYPKFTQCFNLKISILYRIANNIYINYLIQYLRLKMCKNLIYKDRTAISKIIATIKENNLVGLLVDQRDSKGVKLDFFNQKALTTITPVKIAIKTDTPIILARVIRQKNCYYILELHDFKIKTKETAQQAMQRINLIFEQWILEYPDMWFWVHNRWK